MFDAQRFISQRSRAIDASGIRRVFDLAAKLKDPVNLSIGQPDFDVPPAIQEAAIAAIRAGQNRYTVTQGIRALQDKVQAAITGDYPQWQPVGAGHPEGFGVLITSGVSGALVLALLACVGPGDEVLIPDPYFVMYKHLVTMAGATPVYVDTYPDFQVTAARLEKAVTPRTKMLLFNSPSNPTGVVSTPAALQEVARFADEHHLLVVSDEIYDEFCYEKLPVMSQGQAHHAGDPGLKASASPATSKLRCPSLASYSDRILLMRGFSKTWGMTGWRMGWVAGPQAIVEQMTKLQQYTFVCAPSMVQVAGLTALTTDMTSHVQAYQRKRDRVMERLAGVYELTQPGGAFYAFPKVPQRLGLTGSQFVDKAIERKLLIIPGGVFSQRDTHFRLSYACDDAMLDHGLDLLLELAR